MKKLLILSIALALTSCLLAQNNTVSTMTGSGDTVVDASTEVVISRVLYGVKSLSIQAKVTKIGGTVAGTGLLKGSNDGLNFVQIGTDTMQLTDVATQTHIWAIDGSPYAYYEVDIKGSGTDTFIVAGYILPQQISSTKNAVFNMTSIYSKVSDTIVNGATEYVKMAVNQWFETVSIQAIVTRLSGTAGGTVTLQGSNDNSNFKTVSTAYLKGVFTTPYTTGGAATLSVANAVTNTKIFTLIGSPYKYYRLSYTGTGTMSCTLKGSVLGNK